MYSVDAFSGCGGFTSGMVESKIDVVSAIDFYKPAYETYQFNFGNHVTCGDIKKSEFYDQFIQRAKKFNVYLVCGSPPCQGFSLAGLRDIIDKRNFLVKYYFKVVKDLHPRAFLMENVPGILSSRLLVDKYDEKLFQYFFIESQLKKQKMRVMLLLYLLLLFLPQFFLVQMHFFEYRLIQDLFLDRQ